VPGPHILVFLKIKKRQSKVSKYSGKTEIGVVKPAKLLTESQTGAVPKN
jgi:hypothetical protein